MSLKYEANKLIQSSDDMCNMFIDEYLKMSEFETDDLLLKRFTKMCDEMETIHENAMENLDRLGSNATRKYKVSVAVTAMARVGSAMIASAVLAKRFGGAS